MTYMSNIHGWQESDELIEQALKKAYGRPESASDRRFDELLRQIERRYPPEVERSE